MPLIYALVSRDVHVLAEYTEHGLTGNFSTVSRVLLKKIPPDSSSKQSLMYDKYVFHYDCDDGIIYLVMTDQEFNRSLAFQYLGEIKDRFLHQYGDRAKTAIAFAFNADFSKILQLQMEKINNSAQDPKIAAIRGQIAETKDHMMNNIEKVQQRGENIDLLMNKSEKLEQNAFKFQRASKGLKRTMCLKNAKWTVVVIVILALIILFICMGICGAKFDKC